MKVKTINVRLFSTAACYTVGVKGKFQVFSMKEHCMIVWCNCFA